MPEPIVPTTGPDSVRISVPPPVTDEDRAQAGSTHCSALGVPMSGADEGRCMVFFPAEACTLDAAARALAGYGLTVAREGEQLVAHRRTGPTFRVNLPVGDQIRQEAAKLGKGTPYAAGLGQCDACFAICFDSLDEINTLLEVQGALQDASQGILFLPWNGHLSEPWRE